MELAGDEKMADVREIIMTALGPPYRRIIANKGPAAIYIGPAIEGEDPVRYDLKLESGDEVVFVYSSLEQMNAPLVAVAEDGGVATIETTEIRDE